MHITIYTRKLQIPTGEKKNGNKEKGSSEGLAYKLTCWSLLGDHSGVKLIKEAFACGYIDSLMVFF